MTSIDKTKNRLIGLINVWAMAAPGDPARGTWREVEVAIMALVNAAHSRGHAEARRSATDWTAFYIEDSNRSGRRIEKMLQQQADMSVTIGQQGVKIEHLKTERDALQGQLQTQVPALRQLRDEAEAERDQLTAQRDQYLLERDLARAEREHLAWRVQHLQPELADARDTIKQLLKERDYWTDFTKDWREIATDRADQIQRLTTALETLADRYHTQMRYKNRHYPHRRGSCPYVLAVQDANKALAGESESVVVPDRRASIHGPLDQCGCQLVGKEGTGRTTVGRKLFDDRKPQEQPEIEAVLMGSVMTCACGCGAIVQRGQCAYRWCQIIPADRATAPLYASKECARKAAQL